MSRKTPAVAYITRLIRTTGRLDLMNILQNSPLNGNDIELFMAYIDGATYKELAGKYHRTEGAIYARKRKIYEILHYYLVRQLTNDNE